MTGEVNRMKPRDVLRALPSKTHAWGILGPPILAVFLATPLLPAQTLENAKRSFDRGDYREAARLFEQVHRETRRCDVLFFLGLTRYRLAEPGAAIVAFQSATQCDPALVQAHLALAEAYLERRNDAGALAAFTRLLEVAPRHPQALHGAASIHLRSQRNDKAIPLLEKLAAVEPANQDAKADLAAAHAAMGNRDRASDLFQQVLAARPDHASALMGLANLRLKNGDDDAGIALLGKAATLAPKAYEPHFLLGTAYNRRERFADAIRELQTAMGLGGEGSAEVHYHLARAYGGAGKSEDRRRELARFAELTRQAKQGTEDHRQSQRLSEEAGALVALGKLAEAAEKMEEARQLRPGDSQILFRLAGLHLDLGRDAAARNYAQEAVSLAPSEWLHHYLLGLIEHRSGNAAEARRSLETAIGLNAKAAEAHNALGEVALGEGNADAAFASFQRAVDLDPKQAVYRTNLDRSRNHKQ